MTYEYLCTACGNVWEAEQSISAAPLKVCPRCHAETAKRQVSGGAGFILKGGGWYSDLYGSAPKKSPDAGEASSSSESKKASETKKSDSASADSGSSSKESPKTPSGSDSGSKGPSGGGAKGGADSSAA
ncbi:MAG TPA: zinc ribbon domain-containing protein [Polyangiaceae bacterium]